MVYDHADLGLNLGREDLLRSFVLNVAFNQIDVVLGSHFSFSDHHENGGVNKVSGKGALDLAQVFGELLDGDFVNFELAVAPVVPVDEDGGGGWLAKEVLNVGHFFAIYVDLLDPNLGHVFVKSGDIDLLFSKDFVSVVMASLLDVKLRNFAIGDLPDWGDYVKTGFLDPGFRPFIEVDFQVELVAANLEGVDQVLELGVLPLESLEVVLNSFSKSFFADVVQKLFQE